MSDSKETGLDYEALAGQVAERLRPSVEPATSNEDAVADALRALAADPTPKYRDPGAPSPAPRELYDRDATRWSRDYIERMQADGTFKAELEKYRGTLPGGRAGLFDKGLRKR